MKKSAKRKSGGINVGKKSMPNTYRLLELGKFVKPKKKEKGDEK